MKEFRYERAADIKEAERSLKDHPGACLMAGGTDLLGVIKHEILEDSPETIVDLKGIPGCSGIEEKDGKICVGALATLTSIEESEVIRQKAPMIAEAAHSVATPLVRNKGTIGGNLCQDVRCWFYRYPHEGGGRMMCKRKGGDTCYALHGDNRYHSVFGGASMGADPCQKACPAGTDIPAYMEQLRLKNIPGAAQILMNVNPMPMVTSRVCAHFCQEHCNQSSAGESVAIRNVERFVGDYILEHAAEFYQAPPESTGKRVAIVGSGPAGLSAAFYLRQAGNEVVVYDSMKEAGGMLMYAIPAYRLPKDIVRKLIKAYEDMGVKFVTDTKVGKDITAAKLEEEYDSVYYATGTWKRPVLGLSGEELTVFGLDFLVQVHDWMHGKVGQEVLVTGGGNVAMDVAMSAKRLGAKRVILACLESEEEMPAGKEEVARAKEEGIEIMPSWGLSKVLSEDGKAVGMELVKCLSVRDEKGAFHPVYDQDTKTVVRAENILMAVGQQVDLSFLDEKYQLQLTDKGLIDVEEETQMTSRPGVFAGGDVTTGPSTVIQCIANGHGAARGIDRFLGVTEGHTCVGKQIQLPFLTYDKKGIEAAESLKLAEIPKEQRDLDREDEIAPQWEEALEEAKRCMHCGCYAVDPSDMAPALVAVGATIQTSERELSAEKFCCSGAKRQDTLHCGEIVTGIQIPVLEGAVMHYDKFRVRESVDFAIVSLASVFGVEDGKIQRAKLVLGGVAPHPIRLYDVEGYLAGKEIAQETAEKAGELAVKDALPMSKTAYKVQEIRAMIETAVMRLIR